MREYDFIEIDKNNLIINEPKTLYAIDDKTAIDKVMNYYSSSNMDKDIVVEVSRVVLDKDDYVNYVPIARLPIAILKGGVENDS